MIQLIEVFVVRAIVFCKDSFMVLLIQKMQVILSKIEVSQEFGIVAEVCKFRNTFEFGIHVFFVI